ncbi:MAG: diaminopimelate decarboxylase [Alphaproteobacteria bacterium]
MSAANVEAVPLARLAEAYGTPLYVYSRAALRQAYGALKEALLPFDPLICYAVKANGNLSIIREFAELGAGADVVSEGEIKRALAAGVDAGKIIFSGVGKSRHAMEEAAVAGIYQFNVESIPELHLLNAVGREQGRKLPIALRVNPDVDPRTHAKIATGHKESKFGIEMTQIGLALDAVRGLPHVDLCGLAVHIGSQLTELEPFDLAFATVAGLVRDWRAAGFDIRRLDIGGGIGIRYRDESLIDLSAYAGLIGKHFGKLDLRLALEPGRFLVGPAGILLSRVMIVKPGVAKNFLIIDAAMNDLIRPAMYDAWHDIVPVNAPPGAATENWEVVGPVCETGDLFGHDRPLPAPAPGDLVAILSAGAYGASMSSTYNARTLVPEVMVDGDQFALIRRPVGIEEQIAWDVAPVWSR